MLIGGDLADRCTLHGDIGDTLLNPESTRSTHSSSRSLSAHFDGGAASDGALRFAKLRQYRGQRRMIGRNGRIAATEAVGPDEFRMWMTNDRCNISGRVREIRSLPVPRQQPCWMFMSPRKCLDVGSNEVRLAEVVERLSGRVDPVVVFCAWKADELEDVLVQPGGVARQDHPPAFEPVAAGVQAHHLVGAGRRFVLGDLPDAVVLKILDELSA